MIIDCDICGDVIETTAKVIVTPFECDSCKDNGDSFEVSPVNEDACDYSAIAATDALADEYATSEATVELVQDLQQQLENANYVVNQQQDELKVVRTERDEAIKERDEAQTWEAKSHRYLALALERVEEDTKVIEKLEAQNLNLRKLLWKGYGA